uniref:CCHC-type domain-containing protein n=1 Tax=Mycena chlorophos TaxID=658473 RepID=A0ABQ0L0U1_MYCCL|nr:predicted protein [Mycena chlorophos]
MSALVSDAQHDDIIILGNTVRDSKHANIAERDAFLVESANNILQYRSLVPSFVESQPLANAVFTIRNAMVQNNFRTSGPFGRVFSDVNRFAAAINTGRRVQREHRVAAQRRARAVKAAADREERLEALEYANRLKAWHQSPFYETSEKTISLGTPEPEPAVPVAPPSSPVVTEPKVGTAQALSPIEADLVGLDKLMSGLRLTVPTPPSSPHPSMPDLESVSNSSEESASSPEQSQPNPGLTVGASQTLRGIPSELGRPVQSPLLHRRLNALMLTPYVPTPYPHPDTFARYHHQRAVDAPHPMRTNSSVGLSLSTRPSTACPASGNALAGKSNASGPAQERPRTRRGHRGGARVAARRALLKALSPQPIRPIKHCHFCSLPNHTIRDCPDLVVN